MQFLSRSVQSSSLPLSHSPPSFSSSLTTCSLLCDAISLSVPCATPSLSSTHLLLPLVLFSPTPPRSAQATPHSRASAAKQSSNMSDLSKNFETLQLHAGYVSPPLLLPGQRKPAGCPPRNDSAVDTES